MSRYKHLIGPKLRARSLPAQQGEVVIAIAVLNTMIRTAKPVSIKVAQTTPRTGQLSLATESALLQDSRTVLATLHELRGLGIRTALDDVGTGYSSLSYLRSFPFDKVQIDQSFVREMTHRPGSLAIVTSVLDLARKLGMATTAEGVETEEQLRQLRQVGCTGVQGFLFDPPRPAADIRHWFVPGVDWMRQARGPEEVNDLPGCRESDGSQALRIRG